MNKVFAYGVASVQGDWPVLEDGYFVHPMKGIYSIADGFGGKGAGDMAAKISLTELRDRASMNFGTPADSSANLSTQSFWQKSIIDDSNSKILKWNESRSVNKKGGTSLVLAQVTKDRVLTISQCGACVALIIRAGKMSPVLLPQAEPRSVSSFAMPHSALGIGAQLAIERREFFLQPGDYLLLGSSGLHWEDDQFLSEFLGQLALRGSAGRDLGPLVNHMASRFGGLGSSLNCSVFVLEIS